jgi:hypothetical protein
MDLNTNQLISNEVNSSLQNLPKYILTNFVEDSIKINSILNSELRNPSDFKTSINILRVILRDNKDLFCPLFQNLLKQYLSILGKENLFPEEYIYLLVDILHNKLTIGKYYQKWIYKILENLIIFSSMHMEEKENQQIIKLNKYIQYWFDEFILSNYDCINSFVNFFDSTNINLIKISAFYFFKYVYLYDFNKIKLIDWKNFFAKCVQGFENNLIIDDENKDVIQNIFKEVYKYFQKVKVDPNDALIEGGSLQAAKYFEQFNNFNTERAKEHIRLQEII